MMSVRLCFGKHRIFAFPVGEGGPRQRWMRACRQSAQHGAMPCLHQSLISRLRSGCFSVSLAKSSVFNRRRKTPRDALRLVQLSPKGKPECIFAFPVGEGGPRQRWMRACRQSAQHGAMPCLHQSLISRLRSGCFSVSLAKSSVFNRRRKTPRDALRLVQLSPKGKPYITAGCTSSRTSDNPRRR